MSAGGHRYIELGQTPLQPLHATVSGRKHADFESHQIAMDSVDPSDPPDTSTEPGLAAAVDPVNM
jgi:hypothetical protein